MCELFGVSSSKPVQVRYSLHTFAEHGGLIHPNKSGWGIAYREGREALLIKEPEPASDSPFVRFIESQPLTSTCIIAHVRYATAGAPAFANTHPFMRELGGQMHLFAHNGGLEGIWDALPLRSSAYLPVGETDSEFAFCVLLERLAPLWRASGGPPPLQDRFRIVADTAGELATLGPANFLYSDGEVLFVHAHQRHWDEGGGRFSAPRPPGLSFASRDDLRVKGLHVEVPQSQTEVVYVASVPLTEDAARRGNRRGFAPGSGFGQDGPARMTGEGRLEAGMAFRQALLGALAAVAVGMAAGSALGQVAMASARSATRCQAGGLRWLALATCLLATACSGIEPMALPDERENPSFSGIFTGKEGEWIIYRKEE